MQPAEIKSLHALSIIHLQYVDSPKELKPPAWNNIRVIPILVRSKPPTQQYDFMTFDELFELAHDNIKCTIEDLCAELGILLNHLLFALKIIPDTMCIYFASRNGVDGLFCHIFDFTRYDKWTATEITKAVALLKGHDIPRLDDKLRTIMKNQFNQRPEVNDIFQIEFFTGGVLRTNAGLRAIPVQKKLDQYLLI